MLAQLKKIHRIKMTQQFQHQTVSLRIFNFASSFDQMHHIHYTQVLHISVCHRKYRSEIERYIFRLMEMDSRDSEILPDLKLKVQEEV
jgi:hypothetical protein